MTPGLLAEVLRGSHVESLHHGWGVVIDRHGSVLEAIGEEAPVFARSTLKPIQAVPLLETGEDLTNEQWAIVCASHSATPRHVALVRSVLARGDLDEASLHCGAHLPLDEALAEAMRCGHQAPLKVHSNCSGKHAGMLLACRRRHWPLEGYHEPDHPLQQAIRAALGRMAGIAPESLSDAIDGCGVPTWRLPLLGLARAIARLGPEAELERLGAAMAAHPEVVAGEGRFDAVLMRVAAGTLVAKSGAEAMNVGVCRHSGRAWAVKVADGTRRAVAPVVVSLLQRHGMLTASQVSELETWAHPLLRNYSGTVVGQIRAASPERP